MNKLTNLILIVFYVAFSFVIFGYFSDANINEEDINTNEIVSDNITDDINIDEKINDISDYINKREDKLALKDNVRTNVRHKEYIPASKLLKTKNIPINEKVNILYALNNKNYKIVETIFVKYVNFSFNNKNNLTTNNTHQNYLILNIIHNPIILQSIMPRAPNINSS